MKNGTVEVRLECCKKSLKEALPWPGSDSLLDVQVTNLDRRIGYSFLVYENQELRSEITRLRSMVSGLAAIADSDEDTLG
jgi:hypothetical protein